LYFYVGGGCLFLGEVSFWRRLCLFVGCQKVSVEVVDGVKYSLVSGESDDGRYFVWAKWGVPFIPFMLVGLILTFFVSGFMFG